MYQNIEIFSIKVERKIDRFDTYMKMKGLNDNKVTVQLSLSVGLLSKSREKGRDLSDKVIEKILKFYPDINKIWFLTGEGNNVLRNVNDTKFDSLLFYIRLLPISAVGGSLNEFTMSVKDEDCEKIISPIKGIDFAITITGQSMEPEYPAGSQILIKKINEEQFIEWGRCYTLDTVNGVVIKKLIKGDDPDLYYCISTNPDQEKYAPFTIPKEAVFGIYRVLLVMSMK